MAIQTTPHTQDHSDPAQQDFDQNELSDQVGKGYDGQEFQDLRDAQTAGSRNERVMDYGGNEHNVEPTTASEYQQNQPLTSPNASVLPTTRSAKRRSSRREFQDRDRMQWDRLTQWSETRYSDGQAKRGSSC